MSFRIFFITVSLFSVLILAGCQQSGPRMMIYSEGGTSQIFVELARSANEKKLGLMGRETLEEGKGMLFVYDEGLHPSIWMKGMLIPLDIVFIGEDLKINHIEENAVPCKTEDSRQCDRYESPYPSSFVLELPAGYSTKHGIMSGDEVLLPSGI